MDWTWLLIVAGLMFVMHRFGMGCCGGHSHGHGEHDGHGDKDRGDEASKAGDGPERVKSQNNASPVIAKSGDSRAG